MPERWVVGVDIGGTNLKVGVVPFVGGAPLALATRPTRPGRGADAAVMDIGEMAEEVVAQAHAKHVGAKGRVVGVGIGCPGPLDLSRGRVVETPNLAWSGYPIRDRVAQRMGLPAFLDKDANCATYGEWWQGAARGARTVVGVTLGTGVGGGLILDGRLARGATGVGGELGHTTVDPRGRRCGCGNRGCLEAYASGTNIAARAREGMEAGADSAMRGLVDGDLSRLTAETVHEALLLGDAYAHEVMAETGRILGVGLASVVNLLNPEVVVLVGGVMRAGDHLLAPLRDEVARRAFPSAVAACRIVPGELDQAAGVIGAAGVFVAEHGGAA
jgi:glucokinase